MRLESHVLRLVSRSRGGVRAGVPGPVEEEEDAGERGGGEFIRIFFSALGVSIFKASA